MLEDLAGHPINIGSNAQVTKFLYTELGLKAKRFTKGNKPSADDFALADLDLILPPSPQKAGVNLIRAIRKDTSLISKFTTIEYDADGRMRCHYNPGGTTTGRLSSKKFFPTGTGANLQNIPRDKKVRSVFVPDKGKVFFYNDLERAESLVVAKLTGDPTMLEHHLPGTDAHRKLAALLFRKDEMEVTEPERYMGKQTRHAGNYMEGPIVFQRNVNKIANQTGVSISVKEAKYFIGMYRELHPYLTKWWNDTSVEVRTKRVLHNLAPHRRPRHFYDRIDNCLPTAIAYRPQSTVGDVLNIALLRCDSDEELRDLGVDLLVQVHDAIGGQVPEANVERAMRRMQELMRVDLVVPKTGEEFHIPVEITFGPSWGECKKWSNAA
jgi:DNA polymerase-1